MVEVVSFSSLGKKHKRESYIYYFFLAKGGESFEKTMGFAFSLLHTHASRMW